MPRNGGQRGPYNTKHTIICAWCGEAWDSVRLDRQTCSGKCRSRLMRYRQRTGLEPLEPPGEVGVEDAIKELFADLCAQERKRRQRQALIDDCNANAICDEIERARKRQEDAKKSRR